MDIHRTLSAGCKTPLIIAHRGARREAQENTLPAFRLALELGAGGIELDVMLTSDLVPVVTHNDNLSILTPFHGHVRATPYETIRSLNVGAGAGRPGTTMPTLPEALSLIGRSRVLTIVEIKSQRGMAAKAAEIVGNTISDADMQGPVVVSSFSVRIIREMAKCHPQFARALIIKGQAFSFLRSEVFARLMRLSAIHASLGSLSPGLVGRMHRRGVEVHAWTVNRPEDFDRCVALGVDGVITDDVRFALAHFAA
ncbi:MAG: glycerophosphodiester phosphodiesterase [Pseudomonadota bacterium]